MFDFIHDITLEHVFMASAAIGGSLFVVRILLMLMGAGYDDADASAAGGDLDDPAGLQDSDISFKILSLQGITAFFMMFGLVGWAILGVGAEDPSMATSLAAVGGGVVAGLITVGIIGKIFQLMCKLQSTKQISLEETIGTEGTVYLTIPKEGKGKAQIIARGGLKVFDAVSENQVEIKTGKPIVVVRVVSGNILVVAPM